MDPRQQLPPQPSPLRAPDPLPPYQPPPPADNNWQQPVYQAPAPTYQPQTYNSAPQPVPHPQAPPPSTGWQQPAQPISPTPELTPKEDVHNPKYHELNLSDGEHVIMEVHRHPLGLIQIYTVAAIALLGLFFGATLLIRALESGQNDIVSGLPIAIPSALILGLAGGLGIFAILLTYIAVKVYTSNRLYVTNESVIQHIRASLLAAKEQTISLGNIEDASAEQRGLLAHFFNYGRVRLSTEGEHTYYDFKWAPDPKKIADTINNAHEAFNKAHSDPHN